MQIRRKTDSGYGCGFHYILNICLKRGFHTKQVRSIERETDTSEMKTISQTSAQSSLMMQRTSAQLQQMCLKLQLCSCRRVSVLRAHVRAHVRLLACVAVRPQLWSYQMDV